MDTRVFCVYNQARGVFLSSKVTVADSANEPLKMLKVLVGGLGVDAVSGLLLSPLYSAPAVPRLFPFDLLYLDSENEVVDTAEIIPGAEFPPFRIEVASALLVAHHTLRSTQTAPGDRLLIGLKEEIEQEIGAAAMSAAEPVLLNGKPSERRLRDSKPAGNGRAVLSVPEMSRFAAHASFSARVVPESAAVAAALESPTLATVPEVAAEPATDDAKNRAVEETPVISITEVVLERPHSQQATIINGQHGGVEDLFSIWVDTPSSPLAWIGGEGTAEVKLTEKPLPTSVPALSAVPVPETVNESAVSGSSKEPGAMKQQDKEAPPAPMAPRAEKPAFPARAWNAAPTKEVETPKWGTGSSSMSAGGNGWARSQSLAEVSDSTRIAQPPIATAFTVTQYGTWQLSLPTAGTSSAPGNGPIEGRHSATANSSSKPEKAEADLKKTATAKAPESEKPTEDLRVSANIPLFSSAAKPRQEKAPSPALNGVGQVAAPVVDAAGQPQGAKTAGGDSADVKRPNVQAADASIAQIVEQVRKKNVTEPKTVSASRGAAPTTPTSKQLVEKKKAIAAPPAGHSISQPSLSPENVDHKEKPGISTQPGIANGKAKQQPLSLGMRFKRWLNPVTPTVSDRRKAYRRYVPGMVAHYYTGGAPKPHDVADISMTGIYLLTDDRWIPETMIQMTLQKPCARGERKQSITVLAKVVRQGSDGLAAQFVMPETLDRNSHDVQPSQTTDRFALARFI